ncbi:hydroxysqualene dehydroxylase HpnE [Kingella negevensis]|uniref:hydroxysqualene dehydroxylase HpnE n=1 Tax=Kingella negevensis TaxID=1522312 RepID=UPI002543C444|nr:hydroxysqualene dehydroxylase HpnE [Kingella negevensis]WII92534.1 hydroxysqualene dehydroxylase HpnE [Kingella negevensis]
MKKVAIIGAGWAGLSAAATLAPHTQVTLFEASRIAGGRARSVTAEPFSFADNGQHLLIGAYQAIFRLLQTAGVNLETAFVRQPLQWHLADGVQFQAAKNLPAPLNLLFAVLGAKNAMLPEKISLLQQMQALQSHHKKNLPDQSVQSWLDANRVPQKWRDEFWLPMVWGALNTPLERASIQRLCNVMTDGVWASRAASDYLIPREDLGSVFAEPVLRYAQQHGAKWQPETRVREIGFSGCDCVINGEIFDAVIIAVAPYHLLPLLPENFGASVREAVAQLEYHAITTVYLKYEHAFRLPALMTGFTQGTAQWLIDRSRLNGANEIAAVVSVSDDVSGSLKTDWAARVHEDVLRVCPDVGAPIAQQVITEKRATIASTVNRTLPEMGDLNVRGIWLAGDWLHARYPATLEAAVLSGQDAARGLLARFQAA